ncbi:MAG: hypothetical protein IJM18_03030 [Clostridia bacterium]|nr:hypothetical protein [Clostridia bacterium]
MKKLIALLAAAVLVFAAVPALAFTGFDEGPEMPAITTVEDELIPVAVNRVENDPEAGQNEWGETVYTWIPMSNNAVVEPGEDVTLSCEINVPEALEGFDEEALNSIEVRISFGGLELNELVMAYGCDANYECNYDAGFCYPLPGYGTAAIEGNELIVDAHLGTEPQIIVRGIALEDKIVCECTVTIGQYDLPTHFSVGKLTADGETYYAYVKDIMNVQIRGMKFFAVDGVFDHYYVCLNDHDYIRSVDTKGVTYTEVGNEENVVTSGTAFDALELAYETFMGFFGFTDDGAADALTPAVFLAGSEPVRSVKTVEIGGDEPVPTEPAPVDPHPPVTGGASLVLLGAAVLAAGAALCAAGSGKKHD